MLDDIDINFNQYRNIVEETYYNRTIHKQTIPENIRCSTLIVSVERILTEAFQRTHTEQLRLFKLSSANIKYVNKSVLMSDTIFRVLYYAKHILNQLIDEHSPTTLLFLRDTVHDRYLLKDIDSNNYLTSIDSCTGDEKLITYPADDINVAAYLHSAVRLTTRTDHSPDIPNRNIVDYIEIMDCLNNSVIMNSLQVLCGSCEDCDVPPEKKAMNEYYDQQNGLLHRFTKDNNIRAAIESLKIIHLSMSDEMRSYFDTFNTAYIMCYPTLFQQIIGEQFIIDNREDEDEFVTEYRLLEYPEDRKYECETLEEKARIINNFVISTAYYQCRVRVEEIALMLSFVEQVLLENNRGNVIDSIDDIDETKHERILYYAHSYKHMLDDDVLYKYTSNMLIDFGDGLMFPMLLNAKECSNMYGKNMSFVFSSVFNKRISNNGTDNGAENGAVESYNLNRIQLTLPMMFSIIRTYYGDILDINAGYGYHFHPVEDNSFDELFRDGKVFNAPYISETFYDLTDNRNNELSVVYYPNELCVLRTILEKYNQYTAKQCQHGLFDARIDEALVLVDE